ncbi:MAG TPA: serine hydrolase, partial [Roseimicrobium sp.]|nr:serine hydrolase [Roseimicrobium sp.]
VDSSNEATGLVMDALTDTTSGPELSKEELEHWYEKRNAVNRYFIAQGFRGINVNRKPWNDGPYGREIQSVKAHEPNHRNWLTTDATARLMAEIALDRSVSPKRSAEMKALLHRELKTKKDIQSQFTGPALPEGTKLWSKAGWTSQTRHDAVYLELPGGRKAVLVIFTEGHVAETGIIPAIAKPLIEAIRLKP